MNDQPAPTTTEYRAVLLRFSRDPLQRDWRITVRDVNTAQSLSFATLNELVAYLSTVITRKRLCRETPHPPPPSPKG